MAGWPLRNSTRARWNPSMTTIGETWSRLAQGMVCRQCRSGYCDLKGKPRSGRGIFSNQRRFPELEAIILASVIRGGKREHLEDPGIYIYIYIPAGRLVRRRLTCIFGGWGGGGVITSCRLSRAFFGCKCYVIALFSGWRCYVIVLFSGWKCYVIVLFSGWKCYVIVLFSGWRCYVIALFSGWRCYVIALFSGWKCYVIALFSGWRCYVIALFSGWKCYVIVLFSGWRCYVIALFSGWRCYVIALFSGWKCYVIALFSGVSAGLFNRNSAKNSSRMLRWDQSTLAALRKLAFPPTVNQAACAYIYIYITTVCTSARTCWYG